MTVEELQQEVKQFETQKAAFVQLHTEGVGYEMARVLLINQCGFTWGRATDCIEMLESATGLQLER